MKAYFIKFFLIIFCVIEVSAFASAIETSELYPSCLKEIKEIHVARTVCLGWKRFAVSRDPEPESNMEYVAELFYTPVKKLALDKPLDLQLEPRIEVDPKKLPIALEPAGYFIAYATDGTIWRITVERYLYFVTISRLKSAAADDEPDFSKLYWPDLEEPKYRSQSKSLYKILSDNHHPSAPVDARGGAMHDGIEIGLWTQKENYASDEKKNVWLFARKKSPSPYTIGVDGSIYKDSILYITDSQGKVRKMPVGGGCDGMIDPAAYFGDISDLIEKLPVGSYDLIWRTDKFESNRISITIK